MVDELADVSNPGKARGHWGRLVREGRHHRIELAAATQRPQEIDTTTIPNATRLVVFRLGRRADRKLLADELDIELDRVSALRPLEFLDADRLNGAVKPGRIVFAK